MIKRWLRRRLEIRANGAEESDGDEDRDIGALVRKGQLVTLRAHVPANRDAFQRWYADPEIAQLLRHDLEPLTSWQSRGYFDTFILPSSARGTCFAIHERRTKRLIGTTALTDRLAKASGESALFRIVIGEKDAWGKGYGTEATRLVVQQAFESLGLSEVRLEVFSHNARAISAYTRVGFEVTGEHTEWVPRRKTELRVIEMRLRKTPFLARTEPESPVPHESGATDPEERKRMRQERLARRIQRRKSRSVARSDQPSRSQDGPGLNPEHPKPDPD
jgi:RimJ/RimL family protein N-acetyltransferase